MHRAVVLIIALIVLPGCHHAQKLTRAYCDDDCVDRAAAPVARAPVERTVVQQQPMVMQAPVQQYYSPAQSAPQAHAAIGLGWFRLPLPVPRIYAVPAAQPVAMQPMAMMMPQQSMLGAAPGGLDMNALALQMLLANQQNQKSSAPAAAPTGTEDAQRRVDAMEDRIDALIQALEAE